jgi:hypothetical protein
MKLNISLIPLAFLLTANAIIPMPPAPPRVAVVIQPDPVATVLAKGEGDWDSVNRGRAGDTPGGIKAIAGKTFSELTVSEVQRLQRGEIFAVGRYQFIPSTLSYAIEKAGIDSSELFTPEVQDRLLKALLFFKRPAIGAYITGESDDIAKALDEMALEWASVAWRHGRSYYASTGGNRASITRYEASLALRQARVLHLESQTEESNDEPSP